MPSNESSAACICGQRDAERDPTATDRVVVPTAADCPVHGLEAQGQKFDGRAERGLVDSAAIRRLWRLWRRFGFRIARHGIYVGTPRLLDIDWYYGWLNFRTYNHVLKLSVKRKPFVIVGKDQW